MKKFIIIIATLVGTFVACDRELELGSDFDFKVNNITDSEIFINSLKSFNLEITKINNVIDNKNYSLAYKVSGGELIVKDGSISLIEGNFYPFEADNLNKINLALVPQSDGVITVEFILKDNNGVEKTKKVLVYCTDEDFQFTFTGTAPNPSGIVASGISFNLSLTNTGLSSNSFQLKYSSTGTGTITINSQAKTPNTYFAVSTGSIQGLFFSNNVGTETLVFTCLDSGGHEKQVTFNMTITANPFGLSKISDFNVKNTLNKEFKFSLSNTLATAIYQVKFSSNNASKIFNGTIQQNMNTWINLTLNQANLYTFLYEANSDSNDVLTVQVKDSYGQIQTINYAVTVFARPVINNFNVAFIRNYSGIFTLTAVGSTAGYTVNTITGGASLIKTKYVIKNKLTGGFDTLENAGTETAVSLDVVSASCNTSSPSCSLNAILNSCFAQSKYAGQAYSVQIQDSDGVWSTVSNGTCTVD